MSPEAELVPINIGNINEGAMVDAFENELQHVLKNIADLKTPATAERSVTLKLILKPHADRVDIDTTFKCSSKLAAVEVHHSKIFMGKADDETLVAFANDPRQLTLWSRPKKEEPYTLEFKKAKK